MPILLWLSSVFVGFAELVNNWSSSEERSFLISVGNLPFLIFGTPDHSPNIPMIAVAFVFVSCIITSFTYRLAHVGREWLFYIPSTQFTVWIIALLFFANSEDWFPLSQLPLILNSHSWNLFGLSLLFSFWVLWNEFKKISDPSDLH